MLAIEIVPGINGTTEISITTVSWQEVVVLVPVTVYDVVVNGAELIAALAAPTEVKAVEFVADQT